MLICALALCVCLMPILRASKTVASHWSDTVVGGHGLLLQPQTVRSLAYGPSLFNIKTDMFNL